jgi:hypothetical protein
VHTKNLRKFEDSNYLVLGTPRNLGLVLYEIWELAAELEGSLIWKNDHDSHII